MYLKGSRMSMSRRRKRSSPLRVLVLLVLVGGALYINQVVVPATPPLFIPTATPTRSPDFYIQDAEKLIQDGKITQAIEAYKEAVKANPNNPNIYVTLARWEVLYGQYDDAMENIQNALLLSPNHALAHAVRGWILGKQGEALEAEGEFKTALDADPNSALTYAFWAETLKDKIDAGDEDLNTRKLASDYSRKAVDLDNSLLEVRRARGLVLEVTGNYEEAVQEFQAAAKINDKLADLHIALGRNYKALGQYDQAVVELNEAITQRPDDAEPYAELARTYLTVGEFTKGAQLAEQAVEKDPTDPYTQGLLGTLYYKNQDFNLAIKALRLAVNGGLTDTGAKVEGIPLDKTISSLNLYVRYGLALANVGQCGEALQVAQKIMQTVPDDEDNMYNAQVMIDTCKQQADSPSATATPEANQTPEAETTLAIAPTSEADSTSVPAP
jgi:tetratricopeptide (TPR) repeat protein